MMLLLLSVTRYCCVDSNRFLSSEEKVEAALKHLNKPPVKSIKSTDGDIIDCVHISHQPAFDHPLLKNHTIKMRPTYNPKRLNKNDINVSSMMNTSKDGSSSSYVTQLWHTNGKCPKGTIPIRRTKKEDLLRGNSIEGFGKKKNVSIAQPNTINSNHEYAIAYTNGEFYGTQATLNLWNPYVQESNEFSLAQIWIVGGSLETIEVGWQVYPGLYGDTNTRLFIYWTNDDYQTTGCYNLKCSGFIQTNNRIALGGSFSTSQIGGTQNAITLLVWKEPKTENWWLQLQNEIVGYWPSSLFSYLSVSASQIHWGGEVVNLGTGGHHTSTDMGSGLFPIEGYTKASYIRNIGTVDAFNTLTTPTVLSVVHDQYNCYDISTGIDANWGSYFYFGGPGRNVNCP
ncbi:hypothetical protein QVD17_29391 [Tagetes erecta]|uniref:Neprosin PEP catalytic domain-containing protein n=1 Tax=Tagetes erecta TaxID=13708 RepID=A0AAD8NTD5_TARER|nr:hypothetical protein QVD17_29391 [Tagetes erecta]